MTAKANIVILGAGGTAREVAWLLRCLNTVTGHYVFAGYVVTDLGRLGDLDSQTEVLGDYAWLESNRGRWDALALGIGTPRHRLKVADELESLFGRLEWPALVHPSASFDEASCRIGRGAIICANTVATVNVVIDDFAFVNNACTLGHEAHIGRGSVLNPSVSISGGVTIGDSVLVGTGARILQYLKVGHGASVGAGAVVTKNVPEAMTVVGIPAKPLAGQASGTSSPRSV